MRALVGLLSEAAAELPASKRLMFADSCGVRTNFSLK
jgi:hypothetical protein